MEIDEMEIAERVIKQVERLGDPVQNVVCARIANKQYAFAMDNLSYRCVYMLEVRGTDLWVLTACLTDEEVKIVDKPLVEYIREILTSRRMIHA